MNALDLAFWRIILTTWDMPTIEVLEQYAQDCETSVRW